MILHIEALDPLGVKVVANDFCHADTLPLRSILFVKDYHAICPRKSVQIGQIRASKR